ncbi:hypothetical protein D9757_001815 [Collybiopsis confluens]|uniref:Extracellular mutant protein 11 C-terminal domain-containing protein n=1 Tax=Collybiopsis confluens TaxID=2823264 RepID=A0A8H5HYH6_9AGAR|nr:hypothetical protein D9757_001815 [Collybiopsis confluens]
MSTRTPFIPSNPRPASRVAHATDSADKNPQFIPDVGNPLHDTHNKSTSSAENESSSIPVKTLNISGLLKRTAPGSGRRSSSIQLENSNSSANDPPALSATPAKERSSARRDKDGPSSILAPKPINGASAADLLSASFKTPSVSTPSVSTLRVTAEAHIPISEEENPHPPQTLQYKFGVNAPPQRVLINAESNSNSRNNMPPPPVNTFMPKIAHSHRHHQDRDRSNSNKRSRADLGSDDDLRDPEGMYAGQVKRYKSAADAKSTQMGMGFEYMEDDMERSARHSFSPQPTSSPIERDETRRGPRDSYQQHLNSSGYQIHASPTQEFHPMHRQSLHEMLEDHRSDRDGADHHGRMPVGSSTLNNSGGGNAEGGRGSDALDKLLKCQADVYVEDNLDRYERLATRWKECPMDEWVKGTDEIIAKYTKILDFVKDHMSAKLKLFTSFDEKVEAHNTVLRERAKVLDSAKSKLVAQGGNLIG